jgi:hypothetical protein
MGINLRTAVPKAEASSCPLLMISGLIELKTKLLSRSHWRLSQQLD